jgi:hypothetical protein
MMTPAEVDFYAREIQLDRRAEAEREAAARRLAPGLFDRLLAFLRPRVAPAPAPAPTPLRPRPTSGQSAKPKQAA